MEIVHTWSIVNMEQLNDPTETVIRANYCVTSSGGGITARSEGSVDFEVEPTENFIPYEQLTEEMVLGWVKDRLGPNLGNHEINNASWIDSVINPPQPKTIQKPLPW